MKASAKFVGIPLALLLLSLRAATAQTGPVLVDSTSQGSMTGFELYGNGMYWWNDGLPASETNPERLGQIAIRSALEGRWLIAVSSRTLFRHQSEELYAR